MPSPRVLGLQGGWVGARAGNQDAPRLYGTAQTTSTICKPTKKHVSPQKHVLPHRNLAGIQPGPTGLPPSTSHEPKLPITSSRDAASAPSAGTHALNWCRAVPLPKNAQPEKLQAGQGPRVPPPLSPALGDPGLPGSAPQNQPGQGVRGGVPINTGAKAARERSPGSTGDRENPWKVRRNKWKP